MKSQWWITVGIALVLSLPAALTAAPRFVETESGVNIRVLEAGPRTASLTLVLIPGWRFTADIWAEQITAFSDRYRVIAIDPRSQGDSTKTLDGNTPETRAEDMHAVLSQLDAGPVVLVGWSQGAQDVGAYVSKFGVPAVRGIVFVDAAPSAGWDKAVAAPGAAQQLRHLSLYARYPEEATEGMMRAVFRTPKPKAEFDQLVRDALKTPPSIGAAMLEDDLFGPDRVTPLSRVDVPVLLVLADQSANASDLAALTKTLPHAYSVTILGAGHAVFTDKPQEFDSVLFKYLTAL